MIDEKHRQRLLYEYVEYYNSDQGASAGLTVPMLRAAEDALVRGDHRLALELASRIERRHGGDGYGDPRLDPAWLPGLYVKVGQPEAAEQIFRKGLDAIEGWWRQAEVTEQYAGFLLSQGRKSESHEMHERAAELRRRNR